MRGILVALGLSLATVAAVYAQQAATPPLSPEMQALQMKLGEEINANLMLRTKLIQAQIKIDELQHAQNKAPEVAK